LGALSFPLPVHGERVRERGVFVVLRSMDDLSFEKNPHPNPPPEYQGRGLEE
jgi:hypothetical protein